jgi:hypothetical protein
LVLMTLSVARSISALVIGMAAACSLTIDRDELAGGDQRMAAPPCSEGKKECNVEGTLQCVGLDNPRLGCTRTNCIPCSLPHATARCDPDTGDCIVAACHSTWNDCDKMDGNGCEVHSDTDVEHCGRCNNPCPEGEHAESRCGGARCYIRVCEGGYGDCNDHFEDGCEVDLMNDPENCGACERECATACNRGSCE